MAKEKVIAGLPIERRLSIAEAVAVHLALQQLKPGKVERPKTEDKPKHRKVLRRVREAAEGEVRKLSQSGNFERYCRLAGTPCTRRQASKFFHKRGLAYAAMLRDEEIEI